MTKPGHPFELPPNLPVPVDDGAADHLGGLPWPGIPLPSISGRMVELSGVPGRTVVYCYPRTGQPGVPLPNGWDTIPGARGCTPQSCAYRDHFGELHQLGVRVFGLSTQTTAYQREVAERLRLPFELLSDVELRVTRALRLPTFEVDSMILVKRLTLIINDGRIEKVFYPVFPSDRDAEEVIGWLTQLKGCGSRVMDEVTTGLPRPA